MKPTPAGRHFPRRSVHHIHHHRAEEVAEGQTRPRKCRGQRLHAGRRLAVKKMQQAHYGEQIRHSEHQFYHRRYCHGHCGEKEPHPDSLEMGNARFVPCYSPGEGNEDEVVDWGEKYQYSEGNYGE